MSSSVKKLLNARIPDVTITIFVLLVGCVFTFYILYILRSIPEFLAGFKNPLIFSLYYLWIKALIVDIQRISKKTEKQHSFPGFVFWIYASQWLIFWMINDMAYSNSQLASVFDGDPSPIVSLYFSNASLFWLILDVISSALLFPLKYTLTKDATINNLLIWDYLKFLFIFVIFGFISIF